ncbi:MAG: YitT family protein [[Clostridium] innocuum]
MLAACLIGGLICGFGIGLALRSGGSGGGLIFTKLYFTKVFRFQRWTSFNIINVLVFGVCAILFIVTTAIFHYLYSLYVSCCR